VNSNLLLSPCRVLTAGLHRPITIHIEAKLGDYRTLPNSTGARISTESPAAETHVALTQKVSTCPCTTSNPGLHDDFDES
jgi:hypothetical protein